MKHMGFLAIFQLFEAKRSAWLASLNANTKLGILLKKLSLMRKTEVPAREKT